MPHHQALMVKRELTARICDRMAYQRARPLTLLHQRIRAAAV